jgi:molybdopterin/thiamine biosynthesis adenylyltransferase
MSFFTEERLERYSRHIILQEVGVQGQERLHAARVLIIGAGGLGAPAALYLAAAGVGTLGIADADAVDLSNLQRQVIHHTPDVGKPKVESAADKVRAINPDVTVRTYCTFVSAENIGQLVAGYDFVIDGTDNFAAKFLINDACVLAGIPFSHGGILRFQGQTMTVLPRQSACYRCIFERPPPKDAVPTCAQAGVLGAIAGMLGTIQAAEALKHIVGAGHVLADALLTFDALEMNFRKVPLRRNRDCALCGEQPTITELFDEDPPAACELKGHCRPSRT